MTTMLKYLNKAVKDSKIKHQKERIRLIQRELDSSNSSSSESTDLINSKAKKLSHNKSQQSSYKNYWENFIHQRPSMKLMKKIKMNNITRRESDSPNKTPTAIKQEIFFNPRAMSKIRIPVVSKQKEKLINLSSDRKPSFHVDVRQISRISMISRNSNNLASARVKKMMKAHKRELKHISSQKEYVEKLTKQIREIN